MKKQLYSIALLAGMMLTVACATGTEDVRKSEAETKVMEPVFASEAIAFSRIESQDLAATEETVNETTEETHESLIGSCDWSREESYMLAKIAMAEAEGESTEGKAQKGKLW